MLRWSIGTAWVEHVTPAHAAAHHFGHCNLQWLGKTLLRQSPNWQSNMNSGRTKNYRPSFMQWNAAHLRLHSKFASKPRSLPESWREQKYIAEKKKWNEMKMKWKWNEMKKKKKKKMKMKMNEWMREGTNERKNERTNECMNWHEWLDMNKLRWTNWNEWIDMNELTWMTEWIEINELKWRSWNEWIEMNELKWMYWHEWLEMNELTWRNWSEWIEVNELRWMKWEEMRRNEMK